MMKFSFGLSRFAGLALVLALCVGCSGGGEFSTYPVTGKVTYTDGSPLAGGTITFSHMQDNVSAVGVIGPDGTYQVGTYSETDGAPAGEYRVTIYGNSEYGQPSPVAAKFSDTTHTPLKATVKEEANTIDFQVERGK